MGDAFMFDGKLQKDRKPEICRILALTGAGDADVIVAVSPVPGKIYIKTVRSFGDDKKSQIRPETDHFPGFLSPLVGFLQKKIGCKAGIDQFSGRNFVAALAVPPEREAESSGLCRNA